MYKDKLIVEPFCYVITEGKQCRISIDEFSKRIGLKDGDFIQNIRQLIRFSHSISIDDLKISLIEINKEERISIEANKIADDNNFRFGEFRIFINGEDYELVLKPIQFTRQLHF